MLWLVRDMDWAPLVVLAYVVSGTLNHSLGSAIHEIGHNLAYGHGHPLWNRALGMMCNLPLGVPLSVTYKKYHSDHHRYLGNPDLDADIPTKFECYLFRNPITRVIWLMIHPLIHGIRPFYKQPYPPTKLEIINFIVQFSFDAAVLYFLGVKSLFYCVGGTLLGLGLHPLAGHFISEHYMFTHGQATLSYYGPLNPILFNVGYHVEHHDFPYISWRKLPEVKRLAPEFYDHLAHHTSWLVVLWRFIFTPGMGPQGHGCGYLKSDVAELKKSNGTMTPNEHTKDTLSNGSVTSSVISNASTTPNGITNGNLHHKNNNAVSTRSQAKNRNSMQSNGNSPASTHDKNKHL